jgi:hypothetical protein
MKMENKCHTKFRDEIKSMKMTMERTPSIPVKQTAHLSASKQFRVRLRESRTPWQGDPAMWLPYLQPRK